MENQMIIILVMMFFIILVSIQFTLNRLLFHMKEVVALLHLIVNRPK
ncbi:MULTISPECIES: hypothetical protein [unclassified Fusibacter]|nr:MULTISPECIES: hypothetical protein [unclassified Fusibacter]MCK8058323.1 hypothetical protein [Fusibacter sp. A2]NPE20906.1 hypothetical protein [Fusibacter sp. A1]